MALVTLQTIFQDASPASEQTHPLPAHVRRAARAMRPCRTVALGGPVHACPDGHLSRVWDNACRHRACPQCASLQPERWLALQQARRLAGDPSHGLVTLPHALHPLGLANLPVRTTLVLQAVRDTLGPVLADPTSLGAPPGLLAAWHPWSQPLGFHPHVHGLVTGGGRTASGAWQAGRQGLLLPVRGVMAVLRGTMLAALRQAWVRGEGTRPAPPCLNLLNRLGHPKQTAGHVWMMERSRHGGGVVTSLARSLRGGPIKQARLVAYDGERVTLLQRARQEATAGRPLPPSA